MERPKLFVKSRRTTIVTGHVTVESIGPAHTTSDYSEGSTHIFLPEEDASAIDILKRSGITYDQVDLSKGILNRLTAIYRGVKKTPSLLDRNSPLGVYTGAKAISEYASETKKAKSQTNQRP